MTASELDRRASAEASGEGSPSRPARARYRHDYEGIIGRSPAMREVFDLLERVIDTDYPVIIQGDSGIRHDTIAQRPRPTWHLSRLRARPSGK